MEADARVLDRRRVEAEICVVGAGPAGLALAHAFVGHAARVVVLESGGRGAEAAARELNAGAASGDPRAGPAETRHRQLGGTPNVWNTWLGAERVARYAPLDPLDLEPRPELGSPGWPFAPGALAPWFAAAQALCGLGPDTYRAADWSAPDARPFATRPGGLESGVYQLGAARRFTRALPARLRWARHVLLLVHATATGFDTDAGGRTVVGVRARTSAGGAFEVAARHVVLAAGGLENARLLQLPERAWPSGLGNAHDQAGRGFMDHPRDLGCTLRPRDPGLLARARFYDVRRTHAGACIGRLVVAPARLRRERLRNVSIVLRPRPAAGEENGAGRRAGVPEGHVELQLNLEQAPDPDNRVTLAAERDRFDRPRLAVHWRWRDADRDNLARLRALLAAELAASGLGRLRVAPESRLDPSAHHHMGTTRMSADPRHGVVDADARVHGLANLHVAGSSVFPTGGAVNPTLTLVALALRLAERLKHELAGASLRLADRAPAAAAAPTAPGAGAITATPARR